MEQYVQNVTNMSQYVFKKRLLLSNNTNDYESQMWKYITELEWEYLGNCWELL